MKRPQTTTDGEAAQSSVLTDDLESTRRAYKRAKKAYKDDKSNRELKEKKTEAKIALEEAEAAAEATSPSETKAPSDQESKVEGSIEVESNCKEAEGSIEVKSKSKEEGSIEVADGTVDASPDIKLLDEAYQKALSTFKANKTDKDLRRAKTAARRALDNAILAASSDGKQLLCVNCSKKFIFSTKEQQKYEEMGWKELPKRCEPCKDAKRAGEAMMDRSKLDGKKKNMCYSFQGGNVLMEIIVNSVIIRTMVVSEAMLLLWRKVVK